jgi:hypothetical protein
MPRVRRRGHTARGLTEAQAIALLIGGDFPALFGSEQAAREAWIRHREELMAAVNPCTRPEAWWCFEAPEKPAGRNARFETLERLGLLTGSERAMLPRGEEKTP